jgi:non-haem Fe2+, alpha-ketoglutarate-dependent halogenase
MANTNGGPQGLSDAEIQSFKDNGFVGPFPLYTPEEAVKMWNKAIFEMALSKHKPHESTIINYDRHLDCKTLSDHIAHPAIIAKVRSLMGSDIMCWKTNIFPKEPGDSGTGWHQVATYAAGQVGRTPVPALKFTEDPINQVTLDVSVWTAFSPAQRENGCMTFMPGTHKKWYYDELRALKPSSEAKKHDFFGYDYSELKLDPNWDPDKEPFVAMAMEAGQCVLFLEKCIHGSLPNASNQKRVGFASRYVSPSVKVYDDVDHLEEYGEKISLDYHGCVLVSGEDRYRHNKMRDTNLNGYRFKIAI